MEHPKEDESVLSIDEMLSVVGSFGRFQKVINCVFCFMMIPSFVHVMITYFTADTPSWRCSTNSSICHYNGTFSNGDQRRCLMERSEWEYILPKEYSIVTQWEIDCKREWLKELVTSIFFLGWLIGALIIGWVADNYGRKVVLVHSINIVLITGLISAFVPNIYLFLICRFVIGFFVTGTFPQMFLIMTEIVDSRHRAFTGIIIYTFAAVSLTLMGLTAYFIKEWKILYIVTSAPYTIIVVFYKIIPQSIRLLHAKGRREELMNTFHRFATWNKTVIPRNIVIAPANISNQNSHPLQLFKTRKLSLVTIVQSIALFSNCITYYGLYLAAGSIGGSLHLDFMVVTVIEIPIALLSIYCSNQFGRKRTTLCLVSLSTLACIGLIFTPKRDELNIVRISLGMLGKGCNGAAYLTLTSWGMDLFPIYLKAEAMGILQIFTRLGGISAPWMNIEFTKIHRCLPYTFMGVASALCYCVLCVLPESNEPVALPKVDDIDSVNLAKREDINKI